MPKSAGKNDLRQEIGRLEDLLRQEPDSPEFFKLADVYTRSGRFVDAIQICQQGIKHHPHMAEGYVAQGRALFGTGKLNKAIKVLRKAVMLPHGGAEPFRLLGEILLRKDAPTEAVTLLEEAVERGVQERSIVNLLERARRAVSTEQTAVMEVPGPDSERGIGNVAVAGTIGATSEVELTPEMKRDLAATMERPAPKDAEEKTPRVDKEQAKTPAFKTGTDWSSIDDEWEQELDARNTGGFTDIESDVERPFARPKINIQLPPLSDPLTEGMPPLPHDPEESGVVALPGVETLEAVSGVDEENTRPLHGEPMRRPPPDEEKTNLLTTSPESPPLQDRERRPPPEEEKTRPVVKVEDRRLGLADTMLAEKSELTDAMFGEQLEIEADAPPAVPVGSSQQPFSSMELEAADPPDEAEQSSLAERVNFEDLIGLSPEAPASLVESSVPAPAPAPVPDEMDLEPPIDPPRGRSRRVLWMVLVFLVCSGLGGGGVYFWRRHRSAQITKAALALTQKARLDGTLMAIQGGVNGTARARRGGATGGVLEAEAELMRAMVWFHHGEGEQPKVTASFQPWSHTLARALVKLAAGDGVRARAALEPRPKAKGDRALWLLYLAWTDWLQGQRKDAERHVAEALTLEPRLANAQLLAGHMAREVGDLDGAARSCGGVFERLPTHQLAATCLAVTLLEDAGDAAKIKRLSEVAPEGPVGKAWQHLVQGEHKVREGDLQAGVREVQIALAAAPPRPALLFRGVEVLTAAGDLDAALAGWKRLGKLRSPLDPAIQLLEAKLLLAQGLELRALALLKDKHRSPAAALLRARALIASGGYKEVEKVLTGVDTDETKVLITAARAFDNTDASLDPLRQLATKSRWARLFLARVLFQRGKVKAAEEEANALLVAPPVHTRAITLLARIQASRNELGKALSTAARASKSRYLPASELEGVIRVKLGWFLQGDKALEQASRAGRKTVQLAVMLTKARAMAGRAIGAATALAEAKKLGAKKDQLDILEGFILFAQGKHKEAIKALEDASSDLLDMVALARALMAEDKLTAAERTLNKAAALDPTHPLPHLWLGKLFLAAGDGRAIKALTTALNRARERPHFPRSVVTEANIGIVRYKMARGRPGPELARQLHKAAKADPSNVMAHCLLGELYIKIRQPKQARGPLERCVALDPKHATAYYLLGMSTRSRSRQVKQALSRFLELEPKGKRAALARRRLARLPKK